jgi:hypothetical protein
METTQCNFGGTAAIVVLLGMSCCMLMFSVYYGQNSALQGGFRSIEQIAPRNWRTNRVNNSQALAKRRVLQSLCVVVFDLFVTSFRSVVL